MHPEAFVAAQLKGIVGLEVPISRTEGKWKVSQTGRWRTGPAWYTACLPRIRHRRRAPIFVAERSGG
jgi:hypothetical protein